MTKKANVRNQIIIHTKESDTKDDNFKFQALLNGSKIGELQFTGFTISNMKTAVINQIWFDDRDAANELIKEAKMCAWEMGFELMIGTKCSSHLESNGFLKIHLSNEDLFCSELIWDALKKADLNNMVSFIFCQN